MPPSAADRAAARTGHADAAAREFTAQQRQPAVRQIPGGEGEIHRQALVAEETQDVGQLDGVLVEEMLVDHRLARGMRHEHGQEAGRFRVDRMQADRTGHAGAAEAPGEIAQPFVGKREVCQARLPEQGVALMEELEEVHDGGCG